MHCRAATSLILAALVLSPITSHSQVPSAAFPVPMVTAENESWYLAGEPLTYDGYVFHPTGPLTAFNRNEMVRSGFYRGIPLYTRTTYEPWSVVYVPLPGGFMQPYIRRRSGEIGGTLGSIGPGLPVERADTSRALTSAPQAAGPPTSLMDTPVDRVVGVGPASPPVGSLGALPPPAVGTAGARPSDPSTSAAERVVVLLRPRPLVTAARPTGANDAYIDFEHERWYGSGPATELDRSFRPIGEYHDLPVYMRDDVNTIYVPVSRNVRTLIVPYSRKR